MVIMTAKVPKRRLLLIVLLLIAAAVVLALCLHGAGSETEKPTKSSAQGATNEARIAFLEGYGWQVEPEPVKTQQVTVPADPSEVFLRYNELQVSQGYDLLQYSGEELTRYVYRITNNKVQLRHACDYCNNFCALGSFGFFEEAGQIYLKHNTLVDGSLELEKIIPFVADNISVLIAAVSRFIDGLAQIAYAGMTLDAVIEQDLFPKLG